MAVTERDPLSGHRTTGHEWNGIKELNTPIPRVVWLFVIVTHLFALIYWVLMPAWPLGDTYTRGLLGNDQREIVSERVEQAAQNRAGWTRQIAALSIDQVRANPRLMKFVAEDGHRMFGDNCAACHGTTAMGNKGFPNLIDGDWLWGGTPEAITRTIAVGVNSGASKETRVSQMLAFGRDGIIDHDAVLAVTDYVRSLSNPALAREVNAASLAIGREVFAANCVACHGPEGRGNPALGAPNLTDKAWLHGGDLQSVYTSINDGRQGVMPAWEQRLSTVDRKILTIYLLEKGASR